MREKLVGLSEAKPSKELSIGAYYCDISAHYTEILDAAKYWISTPERPAILSLCLCLSVLRLDDSAISLAIRWRCCFP